MKNFVHFFLLSVLTLSLSTSCRDVNDSQSKKDDSEIVADDDKDGVKPEILTYDTFLKKVWNFETSPQEWKYNGEIPAIIDFYADWCGPCRMIAPYMEKFAKEYEGRVKVYKINVDKEKKLASVFQVGSIPLVIFIPVEGQLMKEAGALSEDTYRKIIEENLLKTSIGIKK